MLLIMILIQYLPNSTKTYNYNTNTDTALLSRKRLINKRKRERF